jgi:membrane protein required for colicin V production
MGQILLDVGLLLGLVVGATLGYRAGVMKKIFDIGIVLGTLLVIALCLRPVGSFCVDALLLADPEGHIVALLLLIGVTVIPSMILYHRLDRIGSVGDASRFFGALLGLGEGAFILSMLLVSLNIFSAASDATRDDSLLYRPIARLAPSTFRVLVPLLPKGEDLQTELARIFHETPISKRPTDSREKL